MRYLPLLLLLTWTACSSESETINRRTPPPPEDAGSDAGAVPAPGSPGDAGAVPAPGTTPVPAPAPAPGTTPVPAPAPAPGNNNGNTLTGAMVAGIWQTDQLQITANDCPMDAEDVAGKASWLLKAGAQPREVLLQVCEDEACRKPVAGDPVRLTIENNSISTSTPLNLDFNTPELGNKDCVADITLTNDTTFTDATSATSAARWEARWQGSQCEVTGEACAIEWKYRSTRQGS